MSRYIFLIFVINFPRASISEALTTPIYEYLKDLCPFDQLPLTGAKTVKACAPLCPLGSLCYKGICCVPPPQCRHPSFRVSTGHACLPNVKNNCPQDSQCLVSSQDGMFICCSSKHKNSPSAFSASNTKNKPIQKVVSVDNSETSVCPATHPIIARDGKNLVLCKDCKQGICVKFRHSSFKVCCQSSDDVCGIGSNVLMDGHIPRDCSKQECGKGYECSLTPTGVRVCCSLAQCPSGVFARSVCAAGCLRNEKCVTIQGEMWCCPLLPESQERQLQCPDGIRSTGDKCNPTFPLCPTGSICRLNAEETAHVCCPESTKRIKPQRKMSQLITNQQSMKSFQTTTISAILPISQIPETETEPETILKCRDGSEALFHNGLSVMCPSLGSECPRKGYKCQKSDISDVFVCCSGKSNNLISVPTIPEIEASTSAPAPSCPFSYIPSIQVNNEVQRCLTLFSLDCPFGYTCLPSSTTDSYLCCIRKPLK